MIKMNEEEIEKQLKLSKRQSKDERYDYLCSEFNAINYCINLEKYTNKLQQENKKYKEAIDRAINNSQYWIDYYTRLNSDERIALRLQENIDILKEIKNENKDTRI